MTARGLLKTEPATYAYEDLQRDGHTTWDGVRRAAALIPLRAMRTGDDAMIYHSGATRAVVGIARVTKGAYPDPDPLFANFGLARICRFSVIPVSPSQWERPVELGGR